MALSDDLIAQFVKATKDDTKKKEDKIYGTIVEYGGVKYVRLDGSELLTPVSSVTNTKDGDRVSVDISHHTATVTGNITSPSATGDEVTAVNNKLNQQNNDIEQINNSITQVNNNITQIGDTVNSQNNTITQLNNTITAINSNINTQNSKIQTLESDVNTVKSNISTINSNIQTQESNITTLQSTINTQSSKIETLGSDITAINSSLETQNSKITTLESNISTVNSTIETQNSKISTMESTVETVNSTIGTWDSRINTVESSVDTVNSTIGTWDSRITAMQSTVDTVNSSVETQNSKISTLESNVGTYDSRIETLESTVTTQGSTINTIESNVETINSNISTVNSYIDIYNSSFRIQNGVITGIKGAETEWITTESLEALSATVKDLNANRITTDYLSANYATLDLANVKAGSITTAMIGQGVVGTAQIADGSITDAKIIGLTASKITAGVIDAADIDVINLNAANITVGTINGQQIAPGAVDVSNLSNGVQTSINTANSNASQAIQDAEDAMNKATSASNAAAAAQTTANGKNTVYYQTTSPTGAKKNDIWFNTSKDNQMAIYDGSKWVIEQFGSNAIADGIISADKIANDVNTKIQNAFDNAGIAIEDSANAVNTANSAKSTATTANTNASNALNKATNVETRANNGEFDGRGVSSSTTTYQSNTSGTTAPTGTWSSSIPSVSAGSYLWTRTVITYTDNTTSTIYSVSKIGDKGDKGDKGTAGKGISSITDYYLASSSASGITTATSGWSTTPQSITTTNKYHWHYQIINYTDNTKTTTTPAIIGVYGTTGSKGDTGKGISSVTPQYYLSTSNTAQSGGSWSSTQPAWSSGKYYWSRDMITWSDNSTTYTTAILATGLNNANSTANTANSTANSAKSTADTASANASNAVSTANTAKSTADTAKSTADSALSTANSAKSAAATAQTTADGKNTVFYQTSAPSTSGRKTNDIWFDTDDGNKMYYWNGSAWTVRQFGTNAIANLSITNALIADGTIQNAKIANLDAAKINTGTLNAARIGANTITANKLAIADFTNYAQLNDYTYSTWGFSRTADASGSIYIMSSLSRDKFISEYHSCNGGEYFRIKGTISTTVKGNTANGGTDSSYRGTAIGLYCYNGAKNSVGIVYSTRITATANGTETSIDSIVQIPTGSRYFRVFVQTGSYGNFSGTLKLRNIQVLKAMNGELIVDGAITAVKISSSAITTDKLAANAVTAAKIAASTITADKLAAKTLTAASGVFADACIVTANIKDLAVTGAKIADATIGNAKIANATITNAKIGDGAITNAKIADATIENAKIKTLDAAKITTGTLSADRIGANAITATKIAANAIESDKIKAGAITAVKIAANAVTTDKLSVGSGNNLYTRGYDTFDNIPNTAARIYYGKSGGATASIDTSTAYYGSRCLKIVSASTDSYVYLGDSANGYGCIPVVAGKTYIVSAWMKASASTSAQLYVVGHTAINGTNSAHNGTTATIGTSWTRMYLIYTASSSYPYISIRVDNDTNGTTLWVDAIQVESGTTTQIPSEFHPAGTTVIDGGRIVAGSVTASQIATKTITANNLAADSVTVEKINVTTLSSISANLGTITAGSINIGSGACVITTAGALTATSATITGKVTATSGYIGGTNGFAITTNKMYSNGHSAYNSNVDGVYIGTDYLSFGKGGIFRVSNAGAVNASNITITGGSLTIGSNFNVSTTGVLTASGCNIKTGTIGGWTLNATQLYSGGVTTNSSGHTALTTADFTRTIGGTSRTGLRFAIGSNLGVSNTGVLYASGVNISGAITATSGTFTGTVNAGKGKIGVFNLDSALYTSSNAFGTVDSNIYIGSSGISLGKKFKVTNNGELYAINGTIGGWSISSDKLYYDGAPAYDESGKNVGKVNTVLSGYNAELSYNYYNTSNVLELKTVYGNNGVELFGYSQDGRIISSTTLYSDSLQFSLPSTYQTTYSAGGMEIALYSGIGMTLSGEKIEFYDYDAYAGTTKGYVGYESADDYLHIYNSNGIWIEGNPIVPNNTNIQSLNTSGNRYSLIGLSSSDNVHINASKSNATNIYAGTNINMMSGTVVRVGNGNDYSWGLYLGTTTYSTKTCGLGRYWKDGSGHDMVQGHTDGLTMHVGWAGSSSYKTVTNIVGQTVQCKGSTTWSSDQNLKKDFKTFDDRFDIMFDNLKPVRYKYILGASGRSHSGYVTQQVEEALGKAELTTQEFAGVVITPIQRETETDENGKIHDIEGSESNYLLDKGINEQHNLAYTEFIALNTWQIQKVKSRVSTVEDKLTVLQNQYSKLENKYATLEAKYNQLLREVA